VISAAANQAALKLRWCSWVLAGAFCAAWPGMARASGFHIDEQDAAATGRAGAVTAHPSDASAIYYNPAGLGALEGANVVVGASWVYPSAKFESASTGQTTEAKHQGFLLPQLFASWRMTDVMAVGVGVYAPFGLALDWPASSPGSTQVRQADLKTFFISPVAAFNLSQWIPGLSFGAGFDLVPASVRLTRDIAFGTDLGSAALSGEAFGFGARAGIYFHPRPLPKWAFGLTYRSPVKLVFDGHADFDAPAEYRITLPPDGQASTSITLPQSVGLGISFAPIPEWDIEADGGWRGWSSYDRLDLRLPDGSVQSSHKGWKDSFSVRVGTEVLLGEQWSARLGAIWDQTPVPASTLDFELPDADRFDVSAGFGVKLSQIFRVDASALYVLPQKRTTGSAPGEPPIKGRFSIDAWVVGLSLGMTFETEQSRAAAAEGRARSGSPVPQATRASSE
jgi:long-chain fatty acid transport protein